MPRDLTNLTPATNSTSESTTGTPPKQTSKKTTNTIQQYPFTIQQIDSCLHHFQTNFKKLPIQCFGDDYETYFPAENYSEIIQPNVLAKYFVNLKIANLLGLSVSQFYNYNHLNLQDNSLLPSISQPHMSPFTYFDTTTGTLVVVETIAEDNPNVISGNQHFNKLINHSLNKKYLKKYFSPSFDFDSINKITLLLVSAVPKNDKASLFLSYLLLEQCIRIPPECICTMPLGKELDKYIQMLEMQETKNFSVKSISFEELINFDFQSLFQQNIENDITSIQKN